MMNFLFRSIKNQLIQNLNEEEVTGVKDNSFSFKSKYYPQNIIGWFYKQGIFKVANVEEEKIGKGYKKYIITVKDIDVDNKFFRGTGLRARSKEAQKEDIEQARYAWKYQQESTDEYMYRDETRYEHITPEDSCVIGLMLQTLGYKNYAQFTEEYGETLEAREILKDKYEEFCENYLSQEYANGEEDEEVEV